MTNSKTEAFDLIRNLNTKHNIGLTDEEISATVEEFYLRDRLSQCSINSIYRGRNVKN